MITRGPLFAPSILSANFARLAEEVASVEEAGADWIHVDVMDGHFVPNLTLGPLVVQALKPVTQLPLDCHLMVDQPEKWIEPFAKAGASHITIHAEATGDLDGLLKKIQEVGCTAGVSLNPASPLSLIERVLDQVDLVLIMSVNPGFGGQSFIESSVAKVEALARMRDQRKGPAQKKPFLIEVDGGVHLGNVGRLRKAGVDVFVAGSAIFSAQNRKKALAQLRDGVDRVTELL